MKKSELRQLIREELEKASSEIDQSYGEGETSEQIIGGLLYKDLIKMLSKDGEHEPKIIWAGLFTDSKHIAQVESHVTGMKQVTLCYIDAGNKQ